jgi:glutathione synthase/RimK-type ligase-like ATP-grasp enzyme
MSDFLLVTDKPGDWPDAPASLQVVTAKSYLTDPQWAGNKGLRVVNLCRSQRYLGVGYYCSLLAEARGHRVIPNVRTIQDLSHKAIYSLDTEDLNQRVQRILGRRKSGMDTTAFKVNIYFGQSELVNLQPVARELFEIFPAPLLQVEFQLKGDWRIASIRPLHLADLSEGERYQLGEALELYLGKRWRRPKTRSAARYDLAILYDPNDKMPPSNRKAIAAMAKAAKKLGIESELIQKKDYSRLAEFDALFIRETTRIDHHTYRFARKAAGEGMVVIDDPESILRCTNKIFLAELLRIHRVATPKSVVIRPNSLDELEQQIPYPIVLKIPDGAFSLGVYKVEDRQVLNQTSRGLFKRSELLLAQEFSPTDFDWRIGILNRQPIYVCKYFMSAKHWQIVNHDAKGKPREGGFETLAVEDAPPQVIKTALKAANLIGDGLYGVDLKQIGKSVVVIEVNDNPNIDAGIEDAVLGEELYVTIMEEFLRRMELRRGR